MSFDPSKTTAAKIRLRQKATEELWKRGSFVESLLKGPQIDMYRSFMDTEETMTFWLSSRRLGKSMTMFTTAVSECLRVPMTKVLYLSTTTGQVQEITQQTAEVVLEGCPEHLRPKYKSKEQKFVFPNGSEIRVKGLDVAKGSSIRGVKANLVLFDEACFMRDLNNIIDSVVMPMVIATGGRIILGSTPPDSPGHDSIDIIDRCEKVGTLHKYTIYQMEGILYTAKQIAEFERQAGGRDSTTFRREYMAEVVIETELAILPSFTLEKQEELVKSVTFPTENTKDVSYFPDTYVGMDLGFRDLTVALFGYWDYLNARLIIQDELVFKDKSATTDNIATSIIAKEKELWGNRRPYKRVCDNEPRFIEDIKRLHKLDFKRTAKDNKEAQINLVNVLINENRIVIDPKCTTLIQHMKYGTWKENRKEFARTRALGHVDAVDALVYLVRNVNRYKNPIPPNTYNPYTTNVGIVGKPSNNSDGFADLAKLFR